MSVSPSPDPPGATSSSSAPLSITTVAPTNQSISDAELVKHTTPQSLWLKIHGRVYDFSRFVDKHPGGKAILLKWGGKDATKTFSAVHNQDLLGANLPAEVVDLGESEGATTKQVVDVPEKTPYEGRPPLEAILNTYDLESVARENVTHEAWCYLNSAGDDEVSFRENTKAFHRIWLRPRILRDVKHCDPQTVVFGNQRQRLPIYVSATALGKLYDPEGEVAITRGVGKLGVTQMAPTLASCSMAEMAKARVSPEQLMWYQLYVNPSREITRRVIKQAEDLGYRGLFVTVDAPQLGRRERDMRNKAPLTSSVQVEGGPAHCSLTAPYSSVLRRWTRR